MSLYSTGDSKPVCCHWFIWSHLTRLRQASRHEEMARPIEEARGSGQGEVSHPFAVPSLKSLCLEKENGATSCSSFTWHSVWCPGCLSNEWQISPRMQERRRNSGFCVTLRTWGMFLFPTLWNFGLTNEPQFLYHATWRHERQQIAIDYAEFST